MIKLKTDCTDCVHSKVCQYKHNPRLAMDKLKKSTFESGASYDVCTWEIRMAKDHVDVEFSCPDFARGQQMLLREEM